MNQTLIIDGKNNHDWSRTTAAIREILDRTGRFEIRVATVTEPATFTHDFNRYDLIVSNYYGDDWPETTIAGLENHVRHGAGYVVVHAGGSSFVNRPSYNQMVGLAWRDQHHGDRITLDADGNVVRTAKGAGLRSGHGPCFAFPICHHATEHPVLRGLPPIWMHAKDELWHGLRGPAENMTVLASAFSPRTGAREPILWTVAYDKGRVFVTALGHLWAGGEATALRCVGFRDTLARGCQWAATGEVDLPLPYTFPTEGEISIT